VETVQHAHFVPIPLGRDDGAEGAHARDQGYELHIMSAHHGRETHQDLLWISPGGAVEVTERTVGVNVRDRDDDEGRHHRTVGAYTDADEAVTVRGGELPHDQLSLARSPGADGGIVGLNKRVSKACCDMSVSKVTYPCGLAVAQDTTCHLGSFGDGWATATPSCACTLENSTGSSVQSEGGTAVLLIGICDLEIVRIDCTKSSPDQNLHEGQGGLARDDPAAWQKKSDFRATQSMAMRQE
jgi:hypothetical protein